MVLTHVALRARYHLVVGLAAEDGAALAGDLFRHSILLSELEGPFVCALGCDNVGGTLARIQVCGRLVVDLDGERVEGRLPGRQGRLLFAYLATHREREPTRDELADALWPADAPAAADAALRSLLSKLRRVVPLDGLRLATDARTDLEFADDAIHRAESAVALGEWRRAWGPAQVALFTARRGFLLAEDAHWISEIRGRLDELQRRALEAYGEAALGIGGTERGAAARAGRALVALAPYHESGYCLLMRSLAAEGNAAEGLLVYEQLRRLPKAELGAAPSAATQALHRSLLGA
jgi:DNA-binding SARP family transcriptional activator